MKRIQYIQFACAALFLGACATSRPTAVQVDASGQNLVMQLSYDSKSLHSYQPVEEALLARKELLARKQLSDDLLLSIAELSLLGHKLEDAAKESRNILKKDFKNIAAIKTLVKVSLAQKHYEEAILLIDNGLQVQPRDSDLFCLKGLAYYFLGDSFSARDLWKKAVELNPTHIAAQMNLGVLYFHNRNLGAAGVTFDRVLAMHPQNLDAQMGRAAILDLQGKPDEARVILQKLVQKNSHTPLALYNLAVLEQDRFSNYEVALENLELYLKEAQKERGNIERAISMREELRGLIAKKKTEKFTDAQIRDIAAESTQVVQEPANNKVTAEATKSHAAGAAKPESKKNDDADKLEDAIK